MKPVEQLLAELGLGRYMVRRNAALALLEHGEAAVGPLLVLLEHGELHAQMEAARTLGKLGDPRAVDGLLHALASSEPRLAARAAQALGRLRAARAVYSLLTALDHVAGDVRYEAALALVRLRPPGVRAQLVARAAAETGLTSWGVPVAEALAQALAALPVGDT